MKKKKNKKDTIKVIIPALNEAASIGKIIQEIPSFVEEIIVVDNNSTDTTAKVAGQSGATVLEEKQIGYGYACLRGLTYLEKDPPNIVVFLDGDYSDYPEEMESIVLPIINKKVDFVLGARVAQLREPYALSPQQRYGNALACWLLKKLYGGKFSDLGPFRAIRWNRLKELKMKDKTYGWTIEMQLKVLRHHIPYLEVPVRYRNRIGHSKVSGTVKGTLSAGVKILGWIAKFYFSK